MQLGCVKFFISVRRLGGRGHKRGHGCLLLLHMWSAASFNTWLPNPRGPLPSLEPFGTGPQKWHVSTSPALTRIIPPQKLERLGNSFFTGPLHFWPAEGI